MKAIRYNQYGSPEVLRLMEVDRPSPGEGEVLVRIHAAAANPLDWHFMRADPFFIRFFSGVLRPKDQRLGADIAGRVEALGPNTNQFEVGDEVYTDISRGGFAEYASVSEEILALKPANLSFEAAAAVPVAGLTALQSLRNQGQVMTGQQVLVNGAAGGVGTFAVQIAKYYGAQVTGVCSTRNVEMVRGIGADRVVDYTQEDFTRGGQEFDLILDNVGNRSMFDIKRILGTGGMYLLNAFSPRVMLQMALPSGGQTLLNTALTKVLQTDLVFLKELLEAGDIVPVIDRRYSLAEVPEAIRYLEAGHARGKVVITMDDSP